MKNILGLLLILTANLSYSQTVTKKVEQKANQRANNKVDRSIDRGLDKVEEGIDNLFKKKKKKTAGEESKEKEQTSGQGTDKKTVVNSQPGVNRTSDFVPGTTVIFEDKFEKDALADFPAQWNTNGSGKLVTIDGIPGKWLEIAHNSTVNPVMDKALPENCTIEFDLFLQSVEERKTPIIIFGLTPVRDILKEDLFYRDKFYTKLFQYDQQHGRGVEYGLKYEIGNKNEFNLMAYTNKILHVAMTINKTRVRVYLDNNKIIDLPRALTPEMRNNFFIVNGYVIPASDLGVLVANIRIASAETDARSLLIKQLMEEGRAVTNDILFDVNSDVIKPESFPVINQFGEAMKSNPTLVIKITGHTDSDGNAGSNLTLSQKRAAAVKKYIIGNYKISEARISTDGKGASQPVSSNSTPEGKSKNRRVEFIKM